MRRLKRSDEFRMVSDLAFNCLNVLMHALQCCDCSVVSLSEVHITVVVIKAFICLNFLLLELQAHAKVYTVKSQVMQSNRQRTNFREFNYSARPLPVRKWRFLHHAVQAMLFLSSKMAKGRATLFRGK